MKTVEQRSPVQYGPGRQSMWVLADYGGKDLWERKSIPKIDGSSLNETGCRVSVAFMRTKRNIPYTGCGQKNETGMVWLLVGISNFDVKRIELFILDLSVKIYSLPYILPSVSR